ncbi:putative late blight resistance protein homolog R1B-16 [Andrographis paniculata]|uniref:putative late blight resistance protein homolog R1B-16 n=1 Tax=Andrographis paniculata TaxID=175694 RepID=UPI0021E94DB1|nr:putative late blight resistance protein homolog R1B-16 [Andrographis paniculata]XP_051115640.1 putative late blight resistance protein homolog R1B-16 [Andrographis paniculata]XP_051115641.1 putative late blight resistance protein homolog R1B-16 [Andrographis paniculata]
MAVAAYASLVSLTHVLDNVHYRAQHLHLHVDIKQIEHLQECVNFLLELAEVHNRRKGQKIESLWRKISEIGFEMEETFDLHVVSQLQNRTQGENNDMEYIPFHENLDSIIQKIHFIKRDLLMVQEVVEEVHTKAYVPGGSSSSIAASSNAKNTIVGLDEHVVKIKGEIARDGVNLQIIPIVGMGGIGKTTLAKIVYEDKYVIERFDVRIWLTISQEYSVDEILSGLVNDGKVERRGGNLERPGEVFRKKLYGRRYLIVMDDIWSLKAWDDLRRFFPDNRNGSRIIMTTRLSQVAGLLGSHDPYSMTFLDDNTSWNLFCQTIFGEEHCPDQELEKIGRVIVKCCRGLPLEITVIGGLLANSSMKKEYWESVAENVSSFGNATDDDHCLKVLLLSYNDLPLYLKPCFLYMSVFREDDNIYAPKLINLWVDEGFIKTREDKTLEELAKEYLDDLVDRNLLFVYKRDLMNKEIVSCGIHDLLLDLCLSISNKEHFSRAPKVQEINVEYGEEVCFLCGDSVTEEKWSNLPELVHIPPFDSQTNPCLCGACKATYSHIKTLRMAKVLHQDFSTNSLVQHTKLRTMFLTLDNSSAPFISPSTLQLLWNLQTLALEPTFLDAVELPPEIWEIPQLRVIEVKYVVFPDPPEAPAGEKDFCLLKNLQVLSRVWNLMEVDEILGRIPNLKHLEIQQDSFYKWQINPPCNIAILQKLEVLYVKNSCQKIFFPNSLKKLILKSCKEISWKGMSRVGSLPNLEHLELRYSTIGFKWNPSEGEFLRLKTLIIVGSHLTRWRADHNHYPQLQLLRLYDVPSLKEIPLSIGDIPMLHTIDLDGHNRSVVYSAYKIWKEQQSIENDTLKITGMGDNWIEDSISEFMAKEKEDENEEVEADESNSEDEDDESSSEDEDEDEDEPDEFEHDGEDD